MIFGKKMVLTGLLAAGFALPASGGDLSVSPAVDWSGLYIGGQLGWSHGKVDVNDVDGYNGPPAIDYKDDGLTGRAFLGYAFQRQGVVFGPEIGVGFLGVKDSAQYSPYIGVRLPTDSRASMKADFFTSATGRLGVALDRFLFYGRGGLIGAHVKASFIDDDPTGTTLVSGTSNSKFKIGFTVGGGLEWALTDKHALRLEYMYADLGKVKHTATSAGGINYRFEHKLKVHRVMVGMEVRF